jgi:hypothetical protein
MALRPFWSCTGESKRLLGGQRPTVGAVPCAVVLTRHCVGSIVWCILRKLHRVYRILRRFYPERANLLAAHVERRFSVMITSPFLRPRNPTQACRAHQVRQSSTRPLHREDPGPCMIAKSSRFAREGRPAGLVRSNSARCWLRVQQASLLGRPASRPAAPGHYLLLHPASLQPGSKPKSCFLFFSEQSQDTTTQPRKRGSPKTTPVGCYASDCLTTDTLSSYRAAYPNYD